VNLPESGLSLPRIGTIRTEVALNRNRLLLWIAAGFVAFPLAGLAARAIGSIDSLLVALAAGAIAGAVIGTGQWLVLRGIGIDARWILATAGGFAVGMTVGVAIFGYGTGTADLAAVGAVSGLGIGIAQWPLLYDRLRASALWMPAIAGLWALGWTVSTGLGVDLTTRRWAVFGIFGAVTVALLSGALLWALQKSSPATSKPVTA
jgi:hypothetical protein